MNSEFLAANRRRYSFLLTIVIIILMTLFCINAAYAENPAPDIKANGFDESITIATDDQLKISIGLDTGDYEGINADWWFLEYAPDGSIYYFDILTWDLNYIGTDFGMSAITPTYQGPLFRFDLFELITLSSRPEGSYEFVFAVDIEMDGLANDCIFDHNDDTTTVINMDTDDDCFDYSDESNENGATVINIDGYDRATDNINTFYDSVMVVISSDNSGFSDFKLPDTGQTESYTDIWGEDSDYTTNPLSYTDNVNGTVTDNNTGLMWQQEDDDTKRDWEDAISYCEDLSLAGYNDWRLPEREELRSIIHYGKYSPAINETYFPNTNSYIYWSSTTNVRYTSEAWGITFSNSRDHFHDKSSSYYVRCVRGEQYWLLDNLIISGDGTVTDNTTKLTWQQEEDNDRKNWKEAIEYCEGLSLAGYSDWRLPNIKELASIVNLDTYSPAIDERYFPNTNSFFYWTSTTPADATINAWNILFTYGYGDSHSRSNDDHVRCVRGGK